METLRRVPYLNVVDDKKFHMTLHFFGEIDAKDIALVKEAMDSIPKGAFKMQLTRIGAFPDEKRIRVLWIGVESPELLRLQAALERALEEKGFNSERGYIPHVTLARVRARPGVEVTGLIGEAGFGHADADTVSLYQSTPTKQGHEYKVLHSVKL